MYRKILQEREYSKNELGQMKLPENHYSKRDIERGNEGVGVIFHCMMRPLRRLLPPCDARRRRRR